MIELRQNVISSSGGDRPNIPNVCILLTADVSNANISGYLPEATLTKNICKLIIIGAGSHVSILFSNYLLSPMLCRYFATYCLNISLQFTDSQYNSTLIPGVTNPATDYLQVTSFSRLSSLETQLVNLICSLVSTTTGSTSSTSPISSTLTASSTSTTSPFTGTSTFTVSSSTSTSGTPTTTTTPYTGTGSSTPTSSSTLSPETSTTTTPYTGTGTISSSTTMMTTTLPPGDTIFIIFPYPRMRFLKLTTPE